MERKSLQLKEQSVDMDARTFEGYAATWDIDQGNDIIHPGAFAKSILEGFPAGRIKVLWQHNEPIGLPTEMREDKQGLYVKGKVSKTRLGDEALELMRDQVVDRMSIGFQIPAGKSEYDKDEVRHIREVKLLEFSPGTFPMNEAAIITGVKQIEHALRSGVLYEEREPLLKALQELEALIKSQPGTPTEELYEPQDMSDALCALKDFDDYLRKLKG